jgi:hypothetical protein
VSEYQYYEFQAIDRPLTAAEMAALRACSTRATITPTRFVNSYSYGRFKGDERRWMERYFDAFLYQANWGARYLSLRLPAAHLPLKEARRYCGGGAAEVRLTMRSAATGLASTVATDGASIAGGVRDAASTTRRTGERPGSTRRSRTAGSPTTA